MRLLGHASLSAFRLDLVYLRASLLADDRPEIQALVPEVDAVIARLASERTELEAAEDASVVMSARRSRSDDVLDRKIVSFGGQIRAVDKRLYGALFPRLSPAQVARAAVDREIAEVERILGEIARLGEDHPVQVEHEASLREALTALRAALAASDEVDVGLALARSKVDQFRAEADRVRVAVHGKLQGLLASKAEADEFFRGEPARSEGAAKPVPSPSGAS